MTTRVFFALMTRSVVTVDYTLVYGVCWLSARFLDVIGPVCLAVVNVWSRLIQPFDSTKNGVKNSVITWISSTVSKALLTSEVQHHTISLDFETST
jgi:hypothetical protein